MFGASLVGRQIHEAERLLHWLRHVWTEPTVSLPDVYQRGPSFLRVAATARRVAQTLADHGYLEPVQDKDRREAWRIVRE